MNSLTLHAPRYVLGDLLLTRLSRTRGADVLLVTGGAALIGLSAQVAVPVPGTPVPVTGQTLAVFLCAAALGPWRGPAAVFTYVLAGLAGVPWFAGGAAGLTVATFGYLAGMIAAAAVVGALARYGADRTPWRVVAVMLLGNAVVYAVGVSWLAAVLNLDARSAVAAGLTPFLIGDAAKIAIAAGLLPAAWHLCRPSEDATH
ncbi:biotin transport system substrate-specific component [Actinoplanes campanulatus]|uniref:Biotin transporter n=1 Tax=Actinoplanes campanulatus TaxID=113559 RepID=A0A7W5ARR5_9ACTN|nr:biotin transporter BioY [Actinoplanes campanulatus]MBB3101222.1 biotin transport system substrate-specific component [Actinoplanes campanulatus]GGN51938.1 biotin biosynthesis protein BioY [Actinoplanes campanulatus]GID41969.1 biotin biosynthesis protein BioY [Actinoplanes campanulatus]